MPYPPKGPKKGKKVPLAQLTSSCIFLGLVPELSSGCNCKYRIHKNLLGKLLALKDLLFISKENRLDPRGPPEGNMQKLSWGSPAPLTSIKNIFSYLVWREDWTDWGEGLRSITDYGTLFHYSLYHLTLKETEVRGNFDWFSTHEDTFSTSITHFTVDHFTFFSKSYPLSMLSTASIFQFLEMTTPHWQLGRDVTCLFSRPSWVDRLHSVVNF